MSNTDLQVLRERLGEVADISSALSLLHWDQEVYMPPKGAMARGQQIATLSALSHRLFTAKEMGTLLEDLREQADHMQPDDAKLVEETLYDYRRATCLPEKFVHAFAEECSNAYEAWVVARKESRFAFFQPHLEKLVTLLRQKADLLGYNGSPYNALLEDYERGMTAEELSRIFGDLAVKQSALIERIMASPKRPDIGWLSQRWDESAQWDFTLKVLADMGFDFEAGRQDKSVHPFTTKFDLRDVRVTTRVDPEDLFSALFGSIHEGGHALYEQGILEKDRRTTLGDAPSLGIHESQSRMWENMVGRSLPFWKYYTPHLRQRYPDQLKGVSPEQVYQAVNHVEPSLIRVEADECTYNLHIILRFEIEVALIEGSIRTAEVPEVWNAKVKQYLGLEVPNDAKGCLQDIHWSHGGMGYFPTYALGNLYAAQMFEKITEEIAGLWNQIEEGQFGGLLFWLRQNVHSLGRRKTASEIVKDSTGHPPGSEAFLAYLEKKYGTLYGV
jgi:carboxypeptidase Taq